MIPTLPVYRGETFSLPAEYLDDEGQPKALTGVTLTAWLQTATGTVLPVLTPVSNAAAGLFAFRQEASATALWPKGTWPLYVRYAAADVDVEIVTLVQIKDAG